MDKERIEYKAVCFFINNEENKHRFIIDKDLNVEYDDLIADLQISIPTGNIFEVVKCGYQTNMGRFIGHEEAIELLKNGEIE